MAYQTRKGTKVLNERASHAAMIAEIYHDADEFVAYGLVRVHGEIFAEAPDHILATAPSSHPQLDGMVHLLNLTTGYRALASWDDIANTCKPFTVAS